MRQITDIIIGRQKTVKDAMLLLDRTALTILLLVDEQGRLIRTITDGDLRRLIIKGHDMATTLATLAGQAPCVLEADDPTAALALMNRRQIDQVPVVDLGGRPLGLFLRRDLDSQILLSTPHIGQDEREFVESAFSTNWIAPLGPNVDAFEREFADHVGASYAAAVSSGTAALHLALCLLGVSRGDTVFCSTLTFIASANPILYQGAIPVFIDSEPTTWNMSADALARALAESAAKGRLPKAIVVVNLYGQSADMDSLTAVADRYSVPVIEDAAESLGATYRGRASGVSGRIGVFSFNGNKIITTSGGGMMVSTDEALMRRARFLATQARDPVPSPYYQHTEMGFNYRLSNVLAGIGRGQLKVLEDRVTARRAVFERYRNGLADRPAISWMPEADFGRSTRWLSVCLLDEHQCGLVPAGLIRKLEEERIEARHVWKPLHLQPLFRGCEYYSHTLDNSVSDGLYSRGVCLPSGSNLTCEQQARIVRALRAAVNLPINC
jgi:dTDP-4-amino-4,6-dideoxygalactose transaminase